MTIFLATSNESKNEQGGQHVATDHLSDPLGRPDAPVTPPTFTRPGRTTHRPQTRPHHPPSPGPAVPPNVTRPGRTTHLHQTRPYHPPSPDPAAPPTFTRPGRTTHLHQAAGGDDDAAVDLGPAVRALSEQGPHQRDALQSLAQAHLVAHDAAETALDPTPRHAVVHEFDALQEMTAA